MLPDTLSFSFKVDKHECVPRIAHFVNVRYPMTLLHALPTGKSYLGTAKSVVTDTYIVYDMIGHSRYFPLTSFGY